MTKILILTFLGMPTGHHQVADTLILSLKKRMSNLKLTKIDFLAHTDLRLENIVSHAYLEWIKKFPKNYDWFYRSFVYPPYQRNQWGWYKRLFKPKMYEIIFNEQPDLIICTQALSSLLVSELKRDGIVSAQVINVYTDFFVHKLWGIAEIDYHFVAHPLMKSWLIAEYHVPAERIFVTGIPVDECYIPNDRSAALSPYHIIVSGGNSGLGDISQLIRAISPSTNFRYSILCGNNETLFNEISSWKREDISPYPHISSRKVMNTLYDKSHAIITKPGGVTISEALAKHLPIIIHSMLPGQEKFNHEYLTTHGLAYTLNPNLSIELQLNSILTHKSQKSNWETQVQGYHAAIEVTAWDKILEIIYTQYASHLVPVDM